MIPTISKTHLPLYICLFSGLVGLIIVATLYLDGEVHEARQGNDVWGLTLNRKSTRSTYDHRCARHQFHYH